jgi:hypothetical protein
MVLGCWYQRWYLGAGRKIIFGESPGESDVTQITGGFTHTFLKYHFFVPRTILRTTCLGASEEFCPYQLLHLSHEGEHWCVGKPWTWASIWRIMVPLPMS